MHAAPLYTANLRYLQRHPWQIALGTLGIALGVAIVVSIHLTHASAMQAFDDAAAALVGPATHRIRGGSQGLDERLYARLRRELGIRAAAPVIDADLSVLAPARARPRLIGVDPFAEHDLRRELGSPVAAAGLTAILQPATALLSSRTAGTLGVVDGDAVTVAAAPGRTELRVWVARGPAIPDEVLLVDIATAQELLGAYGRLSHVDLRLEGETAGRLLAAVRELLPPDAWLEAAGSERTTVRDMTRAFHTNLTALGLLALLVGMFLIYNAQSFLLVQRRELFGRLRAVGVTRGELALLIFGEAALLGAFGSGAGIGLGMLLAQALLGLVLRTINDLYANVAASSVSLSPAVLSASFALGIGAALLACTPLALEAYRGAPAALLRRSELERAATGIRHSAAWLGACLAAAGAAVLLLPTPRVSIGFAGLFLAVLGYALLVPLMSRRLMRTLERLGSVRLGLAGREALRSADRNLSRTGVSIAALTIACATGIGIGGMVESFRRSVEDWLDQLLRADFYISFTGSTADIADLGAAPALLAELRRIEGVATVTTTRSVSVTADGARSQLIAYDLDARAFDGFRFLRGDPAAVWARWGEDVAIVSEPYARLHGKRPGDRLWIRTPEGTRDFTVLGVFRDYSSGEGAIAVSRATYQRHFSDHRIDSVGVYFTPGTNPETARASLTRALPDETTHMIRSNREIRVLSLNVFDRTFTITRVLRLAATVIACVGIFASLLALSLERAREFATRRALGLTRMQLMRLIVLECAVQGAAAGLLAIPIGFGMAAALIYVINARSFGWTMPMVLFPDQVLLAVLLALAAAVLAGLYPALAGAREPPARWLRAE
jgi:putative ABC transport system permease protein